MFDNDRTYMSPFANVRGRTRTWKTTRWESEQNRGEEVGEGSPKAEGRCGRISRDGGDGEGWAGRVWKVRRAGTGRRGRRGNVEAVNDRKSEERRHQDKVEVKRAKGEPN